MKRKSICQYRKRGLIFVVDIFILFRACVVGRLLFNNDLLITHRFLCWLIAVKKEAFKYFIRLFLWDVFVGILVVP